MPDLAPWGWTPYWEALAASGEHDAGEPGRIIGQDKDLWTVQTPNGPQKVRVTQRRSGLDPIVGDWVLVSAGPTPEDPWSMQAILPRRSSISRGEAGTGRSEHVLAVNMDRIWIVQGLDVPLNLRRLERYLAVAWDSGAVPEFVFTKTDLCDDLEGIRMAMDSIAVGVPVHWVNAFDDTTVETLRQQLQPGHTICLIGPSGVGKSTLVNALARDELTMTGDVREGDNKGRHTTTRRELFPLPGGACLLDTPGLRELRLWQVDTGLGQTFPEIEALAQECKFRDCGHGDEPGCAVRAAEASGELDPDRLESYRKLQAEIRADHRRKDPRARARAASEWRSIKKSMKQHPKFRRK